jgi:hypothetical protein
MPTFQYAVLIIAIILLVVALILFGIAISNKKSPSGFPPVLGECPDYWDPHQVPAADGKPAHSVCVNTHNLGKGCASPVNFNESKYKGLRGICEKRKFALNCGIVWDGITNQPKPSSC